MARLFIIDERIFNVLPRDVANRIGSPDIRVDTGPLQPLAELVEVIRQRLATGTPTPPGPPVPAPRQGRATTLPSARPTAGLLRVSHLLIAAHGSSGHLQLTAEGLGIGNLSTLTQVRGLVTTAVEIHACAVASMTQISERLVQDRSAAGYVRHHQATPGSLDPYIMPSAGVPTLRQCLVDRNFDPRTIELVRQGRGVVFLIAFARALRVPVTGALHEQRPDSAWRFEKSTITAFPGGRLILEVTADDTTFGPNVAGTHEIPLLS
ncbi:MAG: hypothetical protein AB2L07_03480 [Thermoanaerobaculaceae bacterium]